MENTAYHVFIGTYTEGTDSVGIYQCGMDAKGKLSVRCSGVRSKNPSYLAYDPQSGLVYAANELADSACVQTFSLEGDDGLRLIRSIEYPGNGLCHLSISPDGKWLVGANYGSGNVVFSQTDGHRKGSVWHKGKGVHPRQDHARVHQAQFLTNERIITVDLGLDQLLLYRLDPHKGLVPDDVQPRIQLDSGEGPRHFVLHPNGRWLYIVTELMNHICYYQKSADTNQFEFAGKSLLLPEAVKDFCSAAEIKLSNDARFLFASTRGYDRIIRFRLDCCGNPCERMEFPCYGQEPRLFDFTPDGKFMLIANQKSNDVVVMPYGMQDGSLSKPADILAVPSPSFVAAFCSK